MRFLEINVAYEDSSEASSFSATRIDFARVWLGEELEMKMERLSHCLYSLYSLSLSFQMAVALGTGENDSLHLMHGAHVVSPPIF